MTKHHLETAPTSYQALRDAIASRGDRLPKRMQQIANYLLDHPEDVAFGTVASIAEAAGVASSALVRFGQAFALRGFSDLQALFRSDLSARIRGSQGSDPSSDGGGILAGAIDAHVAELQSISSVQSEARLQAAADLLADAETIYLVGSGRSYAVALLASFMLRDLGIRSALATRFDGDVAEMLSFARESDGVLEIDLWPAVSPGRPFKRPRLPSVAIVGSIGAPALALADCSILVGGSDFVAANALVTLHALAISLRTRRTRK